MRYHDYHLRGYSATDFGSTITLDLVFDSPGLPKDESKISFSDVLVYSFVHTGGAIIIDILQTKLSEIPKELGYDLMEWARRHGLAGYSGDLESWKAKFEKEGYRAWTILSAVGFEGIVIAKDVK